MPATTNVHFAPVSAHKGDAVQVSVSVAGVTVDHVELWGFTTPGAIPSSEDGWSKIGQFEGQEGVVAWDTAPWPSGVLALAVLGYSGGTPMLWWRPRQDVPNWVGPTSYTLQPKVAGTTVAQGGAPTTPLVGGFDMQTLAIIGAVLVAGYFLVKGQD